jgi:hypothetical protein
LKQKAAEKNPDEFSFVRSDLLVVHVGTC